MLILELRDWVAGLSPGNSELIIGNNVVDWYCQLKVRVLWKKRRGSLCRISYLLMIERWSRCNKGRWIRNSAENGLIGKCRDGYE